MIAPKGRAHTSAEALNGNKRRVDTVSNNDLIDLHNAIERMKTRCGSWELSSPHDARQPTLFDRGFERVCRRVTALGR